MVKTNIMNAPKILHLLPGRARIHLPNWSGTDRFAVETYLRRLEGIRAVTANRRTANVLVHFDPLRISTEQLLSELSALPAANCRSPGSVGQVADPADSSHVGACKVVVTAVAAGALGHVAVDVVFYSATAAAIALGWTWVAPLVVVHLILDVFVWAIALVPLALLVRRTSQGVDGPRVQHA